MCLPCTDDPAGYSPEVRTLGDRGPRESRQAGWLMALCGPVQATGLTVTHF